MRRLSTVIVTRAVIDQRKAVPGRGFLAVLCWLKSPPWLFEPGD
jgi:hypothetical protein